MPASLPPWLLAHADRPLGDLIDTTLLWPEATGADIEGLCDDARRLGLGTVCVNGQWVIPATRRLGGSTIRIATVIGFPLGASGLARKVVETRLAVADGAHEVDMVMSLGWARGGQWEEVRDEIAAVVAAAAGAPVKVILETAALGERELELAASVAVEAGAAYLKTSTGFHPAGGATPEAARRLRRVAGERAGVKASGGIRTLADALEMLRAGADRIGTSSAAAWEGVFGPRAPALAQLLGA